MKVNLGSNTISNFIAFFALIISIVAILFTYNVYKADKKEIIQIESKRVYNGYIVEIDTTNKMPIIPVLWECMLTNNGNHVTSITTYHITSVDTGGAYFHYSGMDLGLIKDGKQLFLPINIQAGESIKFYAKVGVWADTKAMSSFLTNAISLDNLTPKKIQYYMALDSIDIFGNSIDVNFFENENLMFRLNSDKKQRIYNLSMETGRKKDVQCKLRWYPQFVVE